MELGFLAQPACGDPVGLTLPNSTRMLEDGCLWAARLLKHPVTAVLGPDRAKVKIG